MECIFIEQEENSDVTLRIAVIDKHRIFQAYNPGLLGTVFECSLNNPTPEDRAEIFYAFAPMIGADKMYVDINEPHRSCKLNTWSIKCANRDVDNLFMAMTPLNKEDKLELYQTRHSITIEETCTSNSSSLFSLVAFSEKQTWKTGMLQRCIDCLVLPQYRRKPEVYFLLDEYYRKIMRFKLETEATNIVSSVVAKYVREMMKLLGLQHSRDTTIFSTIPEGINIHLDNFKQIPSSETENDRLSNFLSKWVGSKVVKCEGGYRLELDPNVTEALSYMTPLLIKPKTLAILETPM